jgi:speckle-type POZ protein
MKICYCSLFFYQSKSDIGTLHLIDSPVQCKSIHGGVFSSNLTEAACVVHLFKINGYSATRAMCWADSLPSKRLAVGGYEWEVHYTPSYGHNWIVFKLILLGAPRRRDVKAALCQLVFPNSNSNQQRQRRDANQYEDQICHAFTRAKESSGWAQLCTTSDLEASGAVKDDAFTVECTITVIAEPGDRAANDVHVLLPSSGLHHHLGELLQNGTGSDVSFAVSGQLFAAHKAILASRSPVFMAQFFGRVKEEDTKRVVEVEDMLPAVFGAMLHFIYTDSAPELDQQDCAVVAQHLLAAADRYGLDRLKLMCEYKLLDGIGINTEATTLALAEQHNCLHLKAKCVELIVANLDAVMATKGYRHLMESCPEVMNDLLKAVSGRNN